MRKTLLSLALILMTAVSAMAQFTATVSQLPTNDYSPVQAEYKLSEIASALNTDAATLAAALQDGSAQFGLFNEDGLIGTTADGPGSYWMKADGTVTNWGNESVVYNGLISYDATEDVFIIPVGQFPDAYAGGETWTNTFTLKYGGSSATLEVIFNITTPKQPTEIAEPVTHFSELNVVKKYTATLDLVEGKSYEGKNFDIEMADLAEVLGCTEEAIADNIAKITIAREFISDENQGIYAFSDSLINHRAPTDGWFGRYTGFDELAGEEYTIAENAFHGWGAGCTVYLQNPSYAEGVYTITYGQYPGTLSAGAEDFITLYIVNGAKAVELVIKLNVLEPEKISFAEMECAGEQVIDAPALEVSASYTSSAATVDVDDILAKLGAESADDITGWILRDSANLADPVESDYWQGETGFLQTWGNQACCQLKVDLANGTANLLQMPRYTEIEDTLVFPIHYIYTYDNKYYKLTFNFTLKPIKKMGDDVVLHCVANEEFNMQIIPSPDTYVYGTTYQLDMDYIEKKIGTTDFKLYGDKWNAEEEKLVWDKNYTCYDGDEKGAGFWFGATTYKNENGQDVVDNAGWGTNSFGFQLSALGVITWFQYPGQRSAGEEYAANIYLVNEETGAYITYTINVQYVSELGDVVETVGEGKVDHVMTADDLEGDFYLDLDVDAICEALEISEEEIEAAEATASKSLTTFITKNSYDEPMFFNAEGYCDKYETDEEQLEATLQAYFTTENDKLQLGVYILNPEAFNVNDPELYYTIHVGLVYGAKRYMIKVTLGSETVVGIKNATTCNASAIYTVAGTKASSLQKGINIVVENGKAKKILK